MDPSTFVLVPGAGGRSSYWYRLVPELERAGRALAMVEHGATILAQVRRRGRELEAQTSLKRGYLNLLHAKEAIDTHVLRVDALSLTADPDGTAPTVTVRDPRT